MNFPARPADDVVISHRFEHARVANLLMGLWLIASSFVWSHFAGSRLNTWLVGGVVASVALLALRKPALHRVNALFGAWLALSTLFIIRPMHTLSWWNNILLGMAVGACSMLSRRGAVTTIASGR
jgi:hypothetical protein